MSLNKISGDDAWMDPPVPIPNTVVKHPEAESTCLVTGWEDRKLPVRSSGDGYVVPPVPIPNTVVKHIDAESTCLVTGWEDRKPLVKEGAVARKHFRADSPVFFDLNHGHLTLAIIMA